MAKTFEMTRFSMESIAKDLYKRVNADKTDDKYYECVDNRDEEHQYYQSINYAEVCVAKFVEIKNLKLNKKGEFVETNEKLYLTTEICVENGVETKYLRAVSEVGWTQKEITLPNGRITHKQLIRYVWNIYKKISNAKD